MNWSSWAGCPTHCQEDQWLTCWSSLKQQQSLRHQLTILTFQELTGQILAFKASALAQHACPQRVRHFCEKYADDAEFWSVWVRAGLLSSRLIFVSENFPLFLLPSADRLSVSSHCRHLAARLVGREEKKQTKPAAANLFLRLWIITNLSVCFFSVLRCLWVH